MSLLLLAFLVALVLGDDAGGPCSADGGACPSEAAHDTTGLLQAPWRRQLAQHRAALGVRVVHDGAGPRRRGPVPPEKAVHETQAECSEVLKIVEASEGISSGSAFWRYACQEEVRERLMEMRAGCLYLPRSEHVEVFYEKVDRINPWHLVGMLESSFFPLEGGKCPTDDLDRAVTSTEGALYRTCADEPGFVGARGDCIQVKLVASTLASGSNLKIYELDGMMGVEPVWASMMSKAGDDAMVPEQSSKANITTKASGSVTKITVKFYVCDPGDGSVDDVVTNKQIKKQVKRMNKHFKGEDECDDLLTYPVQSKDTKFRFKLDKNIKRVTNPFCGGKKDCANHVTQLTSQVVPVTKGKIKILICDTSLLGMASFPGQKDSDRILLINPGTLPKGDISNYNKGDTCTHEMGHYLGLFHTFQGGCKGGDQVEDTDSEQSPHYGCPSAPVLTCKGDTPDPVHNFMDYSDDRCMCSFTEGQRDRMYQQLQLYAPDLLR